MQVFGFTLNIADSNYKQMGEVWILYDYHGGIRLIYLHQDKMFVYNGEDSGSDKK